MMIKLIPLLGLALLTGCAAVDLGTRSITVNGANDPLEKTIKVSSRTYSEIPYESDFFFRAYVDKTTAQISYQMYARLRAAQWVYWNEARMLSDGNLVTLEVDRITSDVSCSEHGCLHTEDAGVTLTREQLEAMASEPGAVKFSGKVDGLNHQFDIDPAEVSLFLVRVDSSI